LKLLKEYHTAIASDYVLQLNYEEYNLKKLEQCFWNKYSYKDPTPKGWHSLREFDDIILNCLPKKLIPYLVTKDLFVLYFHNKRPPRQLSDGLERTVIHRDGGDVMKWYAQINLPVYNCNENSKTIFWDTVGEYKDLPGFKSTMLKEGNLKKSIEFAMTDKPVLFNSRKYHSVDLPDLKVERASFTIRFKEEYSWEDAKKLCGEYIEDTTSAP